MLHWICMLLAGAGRAAACGVPSRSVPRLLLLAALGSLGPAAAIAAGFALSVLPDTVSVTQGMPSTQTVAVSTSALPAVALPAYPIVLGAGPLPAGITASYSALSLTAAGTALLELSSDGTTPPGIYTLDLQAGTVDLLSLATIPLTLTVQPAPEFTLALTPASLSVVQGDAATLTVDVAALNGFIDSVDLAVSGLPSGSAAAFAPATLAGAGQSTLTIATTAATVAGTYDLLVTGQSGLLQHAQSLQLTVTALGTGNHLSISSPGQTVQAGAIASYVISTLQGDGSPLAASNTLSVSGLPPGASASFTPSATAGANSATLSVVTTAATPSGSYVLTVGSALAPSADVLLTITGPAPNPPGSDSDIPLPPWSLALLACGLLYAVSLRRARKPA